MFERDRWIDRYLRRLAFGRFLQTAAEWLAAFLFVFGTAVLIVKLFLPPLWPGVLWLASGAVPVAVLAWRLSLRDRFTRIESVAMLDSRLNAGGLLMTLAEVPHREWEGRLPELEEQWRSSLPRVRPVRFAKLLALPLLFAAAAGFAPLRDTADASTRPPIRQQVSGELEQMLEVLEDADAIQEQEKEELRQEIEKLADQASHEPLTHEKWETVDALRERLKMRLETASHSVSQAQHAAQALAEATGIEGEKLSLERTQQLERDLQQALKQLAENGAFNRAAKSGSQQMGTLKKLLQNGQLKLAKDAGRRQEQLNQLKNFLKKESDKLAECRSCFGSGESLSEGVFGNSGAETDSNRPGRGGINRGRGDANLSWGDESSENNTKFKEVVLPPGFQDELRDEVLGTTALEPEVQPETSAPRAARRPADPASGKASWNRTLRPRHRGVVRRYFDSAGEK